MMGYIEPVLGIVIGLILALLYTWAEGRIQRNKKEDGNA